MPVMPYIWLVYGCSGIMMTLVLFATSTPITGYSAEGYLWLFACAVVPQLIGHSALNYAVGYLSATLVGMITQLEPIGSAFLAFLLFSEVPAPLQMLGSAVILGGVMLANRPSTAEGGNNGNA
jgi:drug/metabolite transporter (DMT)-like permease